MSSSRITPRFCRERLAYSAGSGGSDFISSMTFARSSVGFLLIDLLPCSDSVVSFKGVADTTQHHFAKRDRNGISNLAHVFSPTT